MPVASLRTYVTLVEDMPERASVACELVAVLDDGTELLLAADRGVSWRSSRADTSNWHGMTAEDVKEMARTCVGPDEPREGQSWSQTEAAHWGGIADDLLVMRGVRATAAQLRDAPKDVVIADAVTRRLSAT